MRTPRTLIWAAAICSLLLAGQAVLPVPGGGSIRPARAADTVAPDEVTASAAAEASGVPVEALSDRTQYAQVFANPDGSFTYNAAPVPQRFQLADGTWTDVDTTLQQRADGTVAPVASPANLVLSGGGGGPMLTEKQGADSLSLGWPGGALPAPVLSGSSATYASVLPGVDLVILAIGGEEIHSREMPREGGRIAPGRAQVGERRRLRYKRV